MEAVSRLRNGDVTPLELIDAAAARIAVVEPSVNALPTLCLERARERALNLPRPAGDDPGHLFGLPVVIKDLTEVAGVRTTFGSSVFADHVPQASDMLVTRLEGRAASVIAKSNTPEFGAGAQTFNDVFGITRNPWNTALTPGGSSGGSAVAVTTGEAWLAHGGDLGGSLRIPASFCGCVGQYFQRFTQSGAGAARSGAAAVQSQLGRRADRAERWRHCPVPRCPGGYP